METSRLEVDRKTFCYPHSLGILIEWKQTLKLVTCKDFITYPHSLGILIEWKH